MNLEEQLGTNGPSKCPKNSKFFQQTLPAWHPMFSAGRSAFLFFGLGLFFLPLGIVSLVASNGVVEYTVDYTDCMDDSSGQLCSELSNVNSPCICTKSIAVQTGFQGPVYFYYGLEKFHQNHRRYVRSVSDNQLLGKSVSASSLSDCAPYDTLDSKSILPCGSIANSIFNDTFSIEFNSDVHTFEKLPWTAEGIAWKSDIDRRFGLLTDQTLKDTIKPPNWPKSITNRSANPFKTDEELMVWMRTAALPTFRKLHRRVIHSGTFESGLPMGIYAVKIAYNYPVHQFGGRKFFVLGNTSWLGGKNPILGIICLVTSCLYVLVGIAFFVVNRYANRISLYIHSMQSKSRIGKALSTTLGIQPMLNEV